MSHSPRPRSGAHRPRRSTAAAVVPAALALAAVAALLVAVSGLGGGPDGPDDGTGTTASTRTPSRSASKPTTNAPTTNAPTTSAPASGSATSGSSGSATADRGTSLTVLNATRTSGLAGRAASTLRGAGWTVTTGNYREQSPPTTVYYADADQRATAQAVAEDLGGNPEVAESAAFGDEVTVVLGDDFAP